MRRRVHWLIGVTRAQDPPRSRKKKKEKHTDNRETNMIVSSLAIFSYEKLVLNSASISFVKSRMSTRKNDLNYVSVALFAISATIGLLATSRTKSREESTSDDLDSPVSARGLTTLTPPIPYLSKFLTCLEVSLTSYKTRFHDDNASLTLSGSSCFQNPYDPNDNSKGYIAMCVAENKLILDILAARFMQVGTATAAFSDSDVYCYNSFLGMPVAREAAAYFLARRFLYDNDTFDLKPEEALRAVQPKHVGMGAGAAPLLNSLFFALGNASDACLIPAPYYAAFENDMSVMAGIVPIAVKQYNAVVGPTNEELDLAYSAAMTVRIVRCESFVIGSIRLNITVAERTHSKICSSVESE